MPLLWDGYPMARQGQPAMALGWTLIAALAGGLLTALAEFAWYGLATGINPWRIAKANLMLTYGLRPAVIVTLAGLAVVGLPWLRNLAGRPHQPLRTRAA